MAGRFDGLKEEEWNMIDWSRGSVDGFFSPWQGRRR